MCKHQTKAQEIVLLNLPTKQHKTLALDSTVPNPRVIRGTHKFTLLLTMKQMVLMNNYESIAISANNHQAVVFLESLKAQKGPKNLIEGFWDA